MRHMPQNGVLPYSASEIIPPGATIVDALVIA